jgi:hypothetical protein
MPAEAQSKADATAPFGSLFELRRAHSELMRSVRDRAHISELTQRIRDFLARAAATGAVLRASGNLERSLRVHFREKRNAVGRFYTRSRTIGTC